MTIQHLGQYQNNEVLPTGYGAGMNAPDAGGEYVYNNTVGATGLVGWQVGLGIQPARESRWRVACQTIWRGPDAVWTRADWGLRLSQYDLDGYQDYVAWNWCHGNTVDWQNGRCIANYRLAAGVYYTCYVYWFSSPIGWNQVTYSNEHCSIHGTIMDQGAI